MEFRRENADRTGSAELASGHDVLESEPPVLVQYLTIVRRRKWVILASVAAALLAGLVITMLMTPKYTAAATVEIQRESRNFTQVEGVEQTERAVADNEFYQTQYGLLRSRSLANRVATDLRLFDSEQFFQMFGTPEADEWFDERRVIGGASTRDERVRKAGDILLKNFSVTPERLSRLVEISFTSPDPAFSKRIVDAWAVHFIRATLERRFEATSYARRFLEQRLTQLRSRIDQSERQLVDYATREGIVNLPASSPARGEGAVTGERSVVADDLVNLNRELSVATADRIRAQSRVGGTGDAVSEALENNAISGLRERRAELAAEYARLMVQFEPSYPPALAVQTQVQQLDRSIAREEDRVRRTLQQSYQASRDREENLRGQVGQLKTGLLDLRRRSIQYNIFQRDVDTNRELYQALLQRYKEIGVAGGVGVNNISVVDAAELPEKPSSPRFLLNILLALFVGLGVGAAAAIALEQIDQGISDPGEVESALGIPLVGTVPRVTDGNPLESLEDRKSALAEAYLSLQTNLAFSTDHGVPRSLAVTSTRPAEGKTTTSYALALSIARSKRRVLMVDTDMRSPSVHHLFNIENRDGLSNYLSGDDALASFIRPTAFEGLSVLTAGPQPPSAAELLSSERFERLISELARQFDHIVLDAPPVMGLADAPLIASRVEGTVFVIESHSTQRRMAQVAINRLRAANAQILGSVLTKFNAKRAHYGYGYEYGYGYGYGTKAEA